MEYYIVVFKSRTQTMKFYERLKKNRINVSVINTPRQASLGCGLSVKFFPEDISIIKRLLCSENYHSLGGIFRISGSGSSLNVRPL